MSRYADRILEWTPKHYADVKRGFAEGKNMLQMYSDMGITYSQLQTLVTKMRREGLLPPGRVGRKLKRVLVPGENSPPKPKPNTRGNSAQAQGFYKWVGNATPPINGPLITKIGEEPPGPNAKTFLECNGCMWPVADGLHCGEPRDGGRQPYCATHRKRGTAPWQPSKKVVENRGYALLKSINE